MKAYVLTCRKTGVTQSYTCDNAGNTLSGEGATYTYSPFNRLATASKGGTTTTYAINALGQRVHKKVGSGADHWFTYGPGGQQLGEYNGSWTHYVRLPDGTPIARVKGGDLHMIHTDHLGRPEIVTNSAKAIVWRASNYAFDRTVTLDGIGRLNLGFPGQYYDQETGNWYNVHRTYNPRTGRYLESDPIGLAGGLNTYVYVDGNPITWVDPSGLGKVGICIKAGRKLWKAVTKNQARRALEKGKDVKITGPGRSGVGKQLAREQWGKKTDRHDPHEPGQMPHYQHKNGGRGHVFYESAVGFTAVGAFGDSLSTQALDFFNPVSDVVDVMDLLGIGGDDADDEADETCGCSE